MKRCKAATSRAEHSIECTHEGEHEGSHVGLFMDEHLAWRVIWSDPNAPHFEPVDRAHQCHECNAVQLDQPFPLRQRGLIQLPTCDTCNAPLEREAQARAEQFRSLNDAIMPTVTGAVLDAATIANARVCACGAERSAQDPELRPSAGVPLLAVRANSSEIDDRFSWARVCLQCGAVYCLIWHPENHR